MRKVLGGGQPAEDVDERQLFPLASLPLSQIPLAYACTWPRRSPVSSPTFLGSDLWGGHCCCAATALVRSGLLSSNDFLYAFVGSCSVLLLVLNHHWTAS